MVAGGYASRSIATYSREIRFFAEYFPDIPPSDWSENEVILYMNYLKKTLHASYSKHKMFAQSIAFFFRHILKRPFDTPSKLYPRREFKLPCVLSQHEIKQLIDACQSLKQRALIELFYSSGLRLEELQLLKMIDIDAPLNRIRVNHGKGKRQRYTILSKKCLVSLRKYYQAAEVKPKVFLFEGQTAGKPMNARSIQHAVRQVYKLAGLEHKPRKTHALRHSFATHLLDNGVDIFTIKELLGHSKIETTMVYLHLQTSKRNMLVSPLDCLYKPHNDIALIDKQSNLL
jgi:site-specific recombinase XerD